ncbi:ECF transporter S component [Acetomicrobium sp. UBA5826]|uniref:ECF transporter S component n=1 Tax=Acetomicrobium sp. UBA5826 TaxID=1946039 RepID=UPI00257C75C2|nr:ECF transporter S component [Acetomicrobium sp. UBA5826]
MTSSQGSAKEVALGALFAAIVAVATIIHIPMPGYRIYFNFGEGVIYCVAMLMGAKYGAICGGIGGALADIVLGYPLWAPFTFVIKGIEGFVVGRMRENRKKAVIAGACVMIAGYTLVAGILYGWKVAPIEFLTDLAQTGVGAIIALVILPYIEGPIRKLLGRQ